MILDTPSQLVNLLTHNVTASAQSGILRRDDYVYHVFQFVNHAGSGAPTVDIMISLDGVSWSKWKTMAANTLETWTGPLPFVKGVRDSATQEVSLLIYSSVVANAFT